MTDDAGDTGSPPRNVIYLRTFADPLSDEGMVVVLAMTAARHGATVTVIGNREAEASLRAAWRAAERLFGPFDGTIRHLTCADAEWRRVAYHAIADADCAVINLMPKGRDYPELSYLRERTHDLTAYHRTPLSTPATGPGLLYELCYLDRLRRLHRTIGLCVDGHEDHLVELSRQAAVSSTGYVTNLGGEWLTPRLTAADKQWRHIRDIRKIWALRRWEGRGPLDLGHLTFVFGDLFGHWPWPDDEPVPDHLRHATGVSPRPRRLPPDDEVKVFDLTPVEAMYVIPNGRVVELPREAVLEFVRSRDAIRCPSCGADPQDVVFYVEGLDRSPKTLRRLRRKSMIRGRCQACGRRGTLFPASRVLQDY